MKINIVAVGKRMPVWVNQGFAEYAKRLSGFFTLELTEITLRKRRGVADVARLIRQEGEDMLQATANTHVMIALDRSGTAWSTQTLVNKLDDWRQQSVGLSFLIGGPEGLSSDCLSRADQKWSLSPLTLPHTLVRLILIEAIYRAYTVMVAHPYHR